MQSSRSSAKFNIGQAIEAGLRAVPQTCAAVHALLALESRQPLCTQRDVPVRNTWRCMFCHRSGRISLRREIRRDPRIRASPGLCRPLAARPGVRRVACRRIQFRASRARTSAHHAAGARPRTASIAASRRFSSSSERTARFSICLCAGGIGCDERQSSAGKAGERHSDQCRRQIRDGIRCAHSWLRGHSAPPS